MTGDDDELPGRCAVSRVHPSQVRALGPPVPSSGGRRCKARATSYHTEVRGRGGGLPTSLHLGHTARWTGSFRSGDGDGIKEEQVRRGLAAERDARPPGEGGHPRILVRITTPSPNNEDTYILRGCA